MRTSRIQQQKQPDSKEPKIQHGHTHKKLSSQPNETHCNKEADFCSNVDDKENEPVIANKVSSHPSTTQPHATRVSEPEEDDAHDTTNKVSSQSDEKQLHADVVSNDKVNKLSVVNNKVSLKSDVTNPDIEPISDEAEDDLHIATNKEPSDPDKKDPDDAELVSETKEAEPHVTQPNVPPQREAESISKAEPHSPPDKTFDGKVCINNFLRYADDEGYAICNRQLFPDKEWYMDSQPFSALGTKWTLYAYPWGHSKEYEDQLGLFLTKEDDVKAKIKIQIPSHVDKELNSRWCTFCHDNPRDEIGCGDFCSNRRIVNHLRYFKEGTLVVIVRMKLAR